jgi:hypothetical protein
MRKIDMQKRLSVVLACAVTVTVLAVVGAQTPSDVSCMPTPSLSCVTGTARSAPARRPLPKIKMELLDKDGAVTGSAVTADDGTFTFDSVPSGRQYTVRCVTESGRELRVLGTSAVDVNAPTVDVTVTCAVEPAAWLTRRRALLAALAAIPAAGVLQRGPDASGAR